MSEPTPGRGRRRSRSRSRGKSNKANPSAGKKHPKGGRGEPAPKIDPVEFWGDPGLLPEPEGGLTHAADVRAVITSLGRPPISGQETAAEHWFFLVYERAAFLAGALAAAGGLDQDSTESDVD